MVAREDIHALWDAVDSGDADRVRTQFCSSTVGAVDAQRCLDSVDDNFNIDVVRALLDNGASAEKVSPSRLQHCHSLEIFQLLAARGMNFKDQGYLLLEDRTPRREMIDFLLDQGVNINRPDPSRDSAGEQPPPAAPGVMFDKTLGVLNQTASLGDIDLFDHLVARGADTSKSIALHAAVRCTDPEKTERTITHLIEKHGFDPNGDDSPAGLRKFPGARVGYEDYQGVPLDFAIPLKNVAAVQTLLEHGANANLINASTLYEAADISPDVIQPLIDAGADVNVLLRRAIQRDELQLASLCLEHKADPSVALEEFANTKLVNNPTMLKLLKKH